MLALVGYLISAVVLCIAATGVASGVADAVEGMTRHARSANIDQVYLDENFALIDEMQQAGSGRAIQQALLGQGTAVLNAATVADPYSAPVAFTEAITLGQKAGEIVEEYLTDDEQTSALGPADTPLAPGFDGATPVPTTTPEPAPPSPGEVTSEVVSLAEVAGYYAVDPATVGFTNSRGETISAVNGGITIGTDGSVSGTFSATLGYQDDTSEMTLDAATVADVAEVQESVYAFTAEVIEVRSDEGGSDTYTHQSTFVVGMGELQAGGWRFVLQ